MWCTERDRAVDRACTGHTRRTCHHTIYTHTPCWWWWWCINRHNTMKKMKRVNSSFSVINTCFNTLIHCTWQNDKMTITTTTRKNDKCRDDTRTMRRQVMVTGETARDRSQCSNSDHRNDHWIHHYHHYHHYYYYYYCYDSNVDEWSVDGDRTCHQSWDRHVSVLRDRLYNVSYHIISRDWKTGGKKVSESKIDQSIKKAKTRKSGITNIFKLMK